MKASAIFSGRSWMRRLVDAFRARRGGVEQVEGREEQGQKEEVGLLGLLDRIRGIFVGMGATTLEAADRQRLGGMIFAGSDVYVRGVAEGMAERPELFDVPGVNGADLGRRQRRARCWFLVRAALSRMAEDAGDSYLYEQGLAIEEANRVMQVVKNEAEAFRLRGEEGPNVRLIEQRAALFPALWVMERRAEGKKRARRRGEKLLAEAKKPAAQKKKEAQEESFRATYEAFRQRHALRVKKGLI